MAEMMKNDAEIATPGELHKHLDRWSGSGRVRRCG